MSYQVLARKWRPKSFEELVGQKQTARALINALESQRLHHAYLFTGTRGVGKTTIARILSKSLNCEKGITSKPCGECSSCIEIDQGNFVDLMEIDAASKTKVEDTRELLDNVQYRPTRGRYKVYLIDEVHMLSGHSFNALLKTLEEPPPHVVFLLATTDPQKLPVTVLSRCLQFHLKRMEQPEIIDHLSMILTAEGITFETDALLPIAKGADGSMRDALSLLDQAIAFSGEKLELAAVLEMLGSIDKSYCFQILQSIQDNDAAGLMTVIQDLSQYSPDYFEVMSDWLALLHQIAVAQAVGSSEDEQIRLLSQSISAADLQLYYQLSLQAKKDLPYAPHPRQGFEMALLRVLAFRPQTTSPGNLPSAENSSSHRAKKKLTNTDSSSTVPINRSSSEYVPTSESALVSSRSTSTSGNGVSLLANPKHVTDANIRLVSNNVSTTLPEDNTVDSNSTLKVGNDHLINFQNSNQALKTEIKEVEPVVEYVEKTPLVTAVNNNQLNLSAGTLSTSSADKNVLPDSGKRLYPDVESVLLEQINYANWHYVVDQMEIAGNGEQVLLNSLAVYEDNQLKINHLNKVDHFLTGSLRQSLLAQIKQHFSKDSLRIEFISVETLSETPKVKQIKLHEAAIEKAYQQLIENPCVAKLQQQIGVTIDRASICLK